MSQRAQRRVLKNSTMTAQPVVDGSAVRAVRPEPVLASDLPVGDLRQRVTLSLVPKINESNKRSVMITSVALVLLFVGVIVTLVLMNTSVAQRQYDIVSLRNQERALSQENQSLLKEAESLSSPQSLAKKAADLGLVSPGAPGLIDLADNSVAQDAAEAVKSADNKTAYATLPLPGQPINGSKAAQTETAKENAVSVMPETTVGKSTPDAKSEQNNFETSAETKKSEVTTQTSERQISDDGRPVFTDTELNGGTIPAPNTKSPTN